MKKHFRIMLRCLLISVIVIVIIFKLWESGVIIFDRSANIGSDHVAWNGKEYSITSGAYTEGRAIAKDKSGDGVINMVEEDPTHTFIVVRSFLDDYLLVSDEYTIPTAGKLTTVSWNGTYITDAAFLDAMTKIQAEKTTTFTYETDGIYRLTDNQHMRKLYFAYDDCPVTTNYKGYMGKVNGKWVVTTYISQDTRNENGSPKVHPVGCYVIPEEYWDILSKYFS